MELAKRLEAMGVEKYAGLTRRSGKRTIWNGVVREDRAALAIPHGWKKPRKIFVNSMSDVAFDWKRFDGIAEIRHHMEHSNFKGTRERARQAVADAFMVIRQLLVEALQEDPLKVLGPECWNALLENADLFEGRWEVYHGRRMPPCARFRTSPVPRADRR